MLTTIFAIAMSLHASAAEQTNPYSQNGSSYGSYGVYQPTKPTVCSDPNWDGDCVCSQQKQKIEWVKNHGQSLNSFSWSKIQSKQVVMIGDEHGISNPDAILDLIKLARSESGKQCVFFEVSSDWTRKYFFDLLKQKTGNPDTDRYRRYYGKMANGAVAQGFQVYGVDDPRNWSGDYDPSDDEREIHMAQTIKGLFDSKKCDHAIQIVGKAHVSSTTVSGVLAYNKISVAKINPVFAPAGDRSAPTEEWNGLCNNQKFSPVEATIFTNSGVRDDWVVPSFNEAQNNMRYGDFDYSVLFPEAHFEQKGSVLNDSKNIAARGSAQ